MTKLRASPFTPQLLLHYNESIQQRLHYCSSCIYHAINLTVFPFLTSEQDAEILKPLHLSNNSLPTQRGETTFFQYRTMDPELKVFILIRAASHSTF